MSQAYGWYENAAVHGDGLAERLRDDLLKRMSPTEIDKGEQTAKEIATSIKPAKSIIKRRRQAPSRTGRMLSARARDLRARKERD